MSGAHKLKMLVVEDDPFLIKFYKAKLEKRNFVVFCSPDGGRALSVAQEEKPDLVLLDIGLPGKSGFDVLKELKAHAETREIPVFLVTKSAEERDRKKGEELGAEEYIVKMEASFNDMMQRITEYFETSPAKKQD
ncbi:MAG: response regulator [Patescibacteria group bacterium]